MFAVCFILLSVSLQFEMKWTAWHELVKLTVAFIWLRLISYCAQGSHLICWLYKFSKLKIRSDEKWEFSILNILYGFEYHVSCKVSVPMDAFILLSLSNDACCFFFVYLIRGIEHRAHSFQETILPFANNK